MIRNVNTINHPMPLFNAPLISPTPNVSGGIMHHLHPMPNFSFSAHELLHAHHNHALNAVRHASRVHPYAREKEDINRMGGNGSFVPPNPPVPYPTIPMQQRQRTPHPNTFKIPQTPPPRPPPSSSPCRPQAKSQTPTVRQLMENSGFQQDVQSLPDGVILEKTIPKDVVETMLHEKKAMVVLENGKRTRSDVWLYMGRVKLQDSILFCKDVVACNGCKMVYVYRSKSQGTSTLRHHKCDFVFKVLKEKAEREERRRLEEYKQLIRTQAPALSEEIVLALAIAAAEKFRQQRQFQTQQLQQQQQQQQQASPHHLSVEPILDLQRHTPIPWKPTWSHGK